MLFRQQSAENGEGYIQPISYTRLKEMFENDEVEPNHIIMQLSSDHSGFGARLRKEMDGGN